MSKLFLLKSDHDNEMIGDVILVLDKILRVGIKKQGSTYYLSVEQEDQCLIGKYKTEENVRTNLKALIVALGGDESLADEITLQDRKDKIDSFEKILTKMKNELESL